MSLQRLLCVQSLCHVEGDGAHAVIVEVPVEPPLLVRVFDVGGIAGKVGCYVGFEVGTALWGEGGGELGEALGEGLLPGL